MFSTPYNIRNAIANLLTAGIYALLAQSSAFFASDHGPVIMWWPSGGFALAVVLLAGLRCLPGVFLGAFVACLDLSGSWPVAAASALGNTLEIAAGWRLLGRAMKLDLSIERLHDFLSLLFASPLLAAIGAVTGSSSMVLSGALAGSSWLHAMLHWWMADILGLVLITTFLLVWRRPPSHWFKRRVLFEVILVVGLTFLAGQIIFLEWFRSVTGPYPKAFMLFLFVVIAAIRLGAHGVMTVLLMIAVQALWGASRGIGYFGSDLADSHLAGFSIYMLIMSTVGMLLATHISEKNRAVAALQESEKLFRTLANNASVLVWMSGTDGLCNYFNQIWLAFTGRTLQQELGNGWAESVHPDDRQRCLDTYRAAFDARREFDLEYRLRRCDGAFRWVIVHGVPRYDGRGAFLGYIGSLFDITERKNAEAAMYDSEIRFRSLLETIPLVSVQGYSADGTANYWNRASESLYGYTAREAIGSKMSELIIPPEKRREVNEAVRRMFASGEAIPGAEETRITKGGVPVEVFSAHAMVRVPGREAEMFCMDIDLTERKKNEQKVENLAYYDPLTELPNRRLLVERLNQALEESRRTLSHGAVLFFDLDNFKTLNDTLGHEKGDRLLHLVAKRLQKCVRKVDTVARLGGDEFIVLLKDLSADPEQAPFRAETACLKILAALNRPYKLGGTEYSNTASIGIALYNGNHVSAEDLVKRADIAMYQAKVSGRNTFRFFDPQMQSAVEARTKLENGLRKALPENQLKLYYQIQVDESERVRGAEILLRWEHPEHGVISPAEFVPLAEECGLIAPIGQWVLENACNQLKAWGRDRNKRQLQLTINVSARQFKQAGFKQQFIDTLNSTGANPKRLMLELTENLVQDQLEETVANMKALKQIGVQFSLDDFGTGYFSLSSLKRLPFDQLKIDRSFVRNVATDPADAGIVRTIIAMAQQLELEVIAEGVETLQQKEFLVRHGCRQFQGYLFAKPVPIDQFETLLDRKFG